MNKCRRFENSHLNYVSNSRLRFKQGFKKSQNVKLGDPPLLFCCRFLGYGELEFMRCDYIV